MPETHARSLWPKEHGAYGQLFVPLAGALVVARFSLLALLIATFATAAFLAHEPALVLLGQRGPRARAEAGARAWRRLALVGSIAVAAAIAIALLATRALVVALSAPIALGALLAILVFRRQEKTTPGELVAAAALASWSWPVTVAGGLSDATGALVAFAFALAFGTATLAVRAIIAEGKHGSGRVLRSASLVVAAVAMLFVARSSHPSAALAIAPVGALSVGLAVFRPKPRRLRQIGWGLVAASVATAMVVMFTFGSVR